jgi:hypothetical protein
MVAVAVRGEITMAWILVIVLVMKQQMSEPVAIDT